MEIRQLQHFLAVARAGSLSAAAHDLGMAQSGISSSLAALERQLQVSLVVRSPGRRGVELTRAGQGLLAPAQDVLDAVAAACAAVATSAPAGQVRGLVGVATVHTPPELGILETLLDFQSQHPDVQVSTTSATNDEVLSLVAGEKVDWGIAAVGPRDDVGLDITLITSSPLVLVCSPGHRLALFEEVTPEDLAEERVLGRPAKHRTRRLLDAWLLGGGVTSHQLEIIDSDDQEAVLDVVLRGRGVTYGPAAYSQAIHGGGSVLVPLRDGPVWQLSVVTAPGGPLSAAAVALCSAHVQRCAAVIGAAGCSEGR